MQIRQIENKQANDVAKIQQDAAGALIETEKTTWATRLQIVMDGAAKIASALAKSYAEQQAKIQGVIAGRRKRYEPSA